MTRSFSIWAAVAAAFWASACGGGGAPTPAAPLPPTVVAPQPTPTPAGGVSPVVGSCALGKGDPDASCSRTSPRLLDTVEAAIDTLVARRPDLFNLQDELGGHTGLYRVLDKEAYLDGVIANLVAAGLCAARSLDRDKVEVKNSADFSEEYDVWASTGHIRRGVGTYRATCEPASFPVELGDLLSYVRIAFFGFQCLPGVPIPAVPNDRLPVGCAGDLTATPKRKDHTDIPAWMYANDITWVLKDGEGVVDAVPDPLFQNPFNQRLIPRGPLGPFQLCAIVHGVEGCLSGQTVP